MEDRTISSIARQQARKRKTGRAGMMLFFFIFAAAGGGMLYPLGIRPIARTIDAESWLEVPCRVTSAEVLSHSDSDGTTYSIEIGYEYEVDGRAYHGGRYDFIGGSSSGYNSKARVVEQYKTAANPVCYVNPDKPSESVLKRGWHPKLLFALFPLPFLCVGIGGLIHTIRSRPGSARLAKQAWLPKKDGAAAPELGVLAIDGTCPGEAVLRPKYSPWMKVFGMILVALFWNGIVSVFVVDVIGGWRNGAGDLFHTLFMIPFLLVGLGLIAGVFYMLLATANPRPVLRLSSAVMQLGGTGHLRWEFTGRTSVMRKLRILLRAREEARYRRGTKTYTDKNTFFEMEVFSTEDPYQMAGGDAGIVLPSESMHSFEAENNKIIWELGVHGEIKSWPDVKESFRITVAPAAV